MTKLVQSNTWADHWLRARRDLTLWLGSSTADFIVGVSCCWEYCAQNLWTAGSHDPAPSLLPDLPLWQSLCRWQTPPPSAVSKGCREVSLASSSVLDTPWHICCLLWSQGLLCWSCEPRGGSQFAHKSSNIDGNGTHTFLVGFTECSVEKILKYQGPNISLSIKC